MAISLVDDANVKLPATEYDQVTALNFGKLENKPRLCLKISEEWAAIAANRDYLIYFPKGDLCIIDTHGNEQLKLKRNFAVSDVCWSSHLNQFLILPDADTILYSLEMAGSTTPQIKRIKDFSGRMWSCTCHTDTLIVSSYGIRSYMEEYNMTDWKLVRTVRLSESDKHNQYIYKIRFNSSGSCLGIIQREGELHNWKYWFELRDRYNMNILQIVQLEGSSNGLLSLPKQQFLISAWRDKGLLLIDPVNRYKQAISYDTAVDATALIDEKYLVVQTTKPSELRLYDL